MADILDISSDRELMACIRESANSDVEWETKLKEQIGKFLYDVYEKHAPEKIIRG